MAARENFDNESDYGSDLSPEDELLLIQLVSGTEQSLISTGVSAAPSRDLACFYNQPGQTDAIVHNGSSTFAREATSARLQATQPVGYDSSSRCAEWVIDASLGTDVTYPDLSRALTEIEALKGKDAVDKTQPAKSDTSEDDRSPLQRFRSFPKRPLTVTDLAAGAWCELQYWYTLTKLPGGRPTRTAAMKRGSKIHKELEEEVHETVHIDVLTKEDAFALKLWNFINGLRTLRITGLTRELEVWGVVDGNFVNGIIDSVSHQNPNPDFENKLMEKTQRDPKQKSLTDFFALGEKSTKKKPSAEIYLTDVKTRGSLAPITKPLLRPAKIQLMLYHRFLSQIAAGKLDFLKLFGRYGLDADNPFSDTFVDQMGDLHDETFHDSSSGSIANGDGKSGAGEGIYTEGSTSSGQLKYQTLRELVSLVKEEVERTFPDGEASMGQMLRVQYVRRDDGSEIDTHDFPVSGPVLDGYLKGYMAWWQGEREASGVDIEEAFKCRVCEFAEECSWRNARVEERMVFTRRKKSGSLGP